MGPWIKRDKYLRRYFTEAKFRENEIKKSQQRVSFIRYLFIAVMVGIFVLYLMKEAGHPF